MGDETLNTEQNNDLDSRIQEQSNGYTIVLIQFSANEESRSYIPCCSPTEAIESVLRIYETFLIERGAPLIQRSTTIESQQNKLDQEPVQTQQSKAAKNDPTQETLVYTLEDFMKFVDQLFDLASLSFNSKANGFTAHGKAWFKGKAHSYMRKNANQLNADVPQQDETAEADEPMQE